MEPNKKITYQVHARIHGDWCHLQTYTPSRLALAKAHIKELRANHPNREYRLTQATLSTMEII